MYCSCLFVPLHPEIELYKQMTMKKRLFGSMLASLMAVASMGQVSKTLSPYTQFGIGALADQTQSLGRGMGGLSFGVRDSKFANVSNPASYSTLKHKKGFSQPGDGGVGTVSYPYKSRILALSHLSFQMKNIIYT